MFEKVRFLWHVYRALEADKHPEDILAFFEATKEKTDNPVIAGFCDEAAESLDVGLAEIVLVKNEVDFSAEATFFFYVGALWERYDLLTGADLD